MPIVTINMREGHSPAFKKTVLDCVHGALIDAFGIADWDRFQRIAEFSAADFEAPDFKSEDFMIVEVTVFPGRTKEQKRAAIEQITERICAKLGTEPGDVFVIFHEPPLENWGMGGKQKEA